MSSIAPADRWWIRFSWIWLALLVPSLVFSNGRWQLAVALTGWRDEIT